MRILSVIKNKNEKKITILGFMLYHKVSKINEKKTKILYGIFKIKEKNNHKKFYLFGIQIFSKRVQADINLILNNVKNEILNENRAILSVYNLHQKVFPQFKNCNLNKNIAIIGCGPTVNYYQDNSNFINIGLNKAYKNKNIKFDYIFFVDSAHKGNAFDELIDIDCVKFLGFHCNPEFSYCNQDILYNEKNISFCLIPDNYVIKNNAYRFYSNAHRNEIFYDIETSPLMDFGSISFPAIHFALYTHPQKIYLIGCDTSNNGYFTQEEQPNWNKDMLNRTFWGYKRLKKFVSVFYPDIEIVSVNPVGLKGMFKDVYTRSYVDANPELFINKEITYLDEEGLCV